MPGYCGTRTAAADVTATPSDSNFKNTWVCEMKLGPDDVCAYTYPQTPHVEARKVGGSWVCYKENAG